MKRKHESLGMVIAVTARWLKIRFSSVLKPFGITPEQFGVLMRLWEEDGLQQIQISMDTSKDPPNTARILRRLEVRGLISRKSDPRDRRATRVFLTHEGRCLESRVMPKVKAFRARAFGNLDKEDCNQLIRLLQQITLELQSMEDGGEI